MAKRVELIQRFVAYDAAGNAHTLLVLEDVISARSHDDPNGEIRGLKSIKTIDGRAVNRIDKGKYRVVFPELDLTSDDPASP